MINKLIKTEKDYNLVLSRIEALMDADANTPEAEELELLATLVELYEDEHFAMDTPEPIDAIKFRMEQLGLNQQDLVPFIGNKSKVSEILNEKRPLTLSMMRSLHQNLGIPAEVFLQKTGKTFPKAIPNIEWHLFPFKEMSKRGWISQLKNYKDSAEETMRIFIKDCCPNGETIEACFRENSGNRINAKADSYALNSWCMRIMALAQKNILKRKFDPEKFTSDSLKEIAKLSFFEEGPLLAREFLEKHGIHMIIERHLPKTYLDGVALLLEDSTPVVGLTLRYDRIDNFWFCLLHELAHIVLHLGKSNKNVFVDDMDIKNTGGGKQNDIENEADFLAMESLIPNDVWTVSNAKINPTKKNVLELAENLKIHPACIAGRVRFEQHNFKLLSRVVGSGKIRKLFEI
ncbi:ImmA/IrrE family metallo-endopeptidase [uncultured Desulfobacter sp.]|uniref:ImmA/IrrE family metallo-endopeptidase n=1 Tax=uncultured Desulfobacter sp. TaxID=240139 RepID=UPI002AAB0360|nr:ImmA/IrrE family metallo-endopeptidase [uncultured Desulfobacter sp.]